MKLVLRERPKNLSTRPVSRSHRVWRRVVLIALLTLVVLVAMGGAYLLLRPRVQPLSLPAISAHLSPADLGLANWQAYQQPLPANPLTNPALPSSPQVKADLALLEDAAGQAMIHQGEFNRGIAYLRVTVQAVPDNLRYANDYRLALLDHGRYMDQEDFFMSQEQAV